ncbi:MAG TPA: putative LPS assembly protein LptD, partial [Taishania sp.]|nr:putative LPS assembly protein LptD [Taishania sp.]
MCVPTQLLGQTTPVDTIYINDDSMGGISKYSARDSVYADLKKKQLHLYGEATVESEDMNLKAGYILIDMNTEEVTATYVLDEEGKMIEKPLFNMGGDQVEANTLKYNLNTKKAYIEAVKIKQDEMYLYMGKAKRQANEDIHFVDGRFTTCDLDEPHYHFQLSRAVLVPNKRIVTGPMNLHIAGVPTPLGLPFSYIPQKDQSDRTHGLLFPELVPVSQYGFGLNNLGYYIPINDYVQTSIYGTIYSRGSWGL